MNSPRRISRYLVKALSAGAVVIAAALPLAIAGEASAAAPGVLTAGTTAVNFDMAAAVGGNGTQTTGTSFGQGGNGEILVTAASGFAADGGAVTVTSNAPGVVFFGATDTATTVTANFTSSASTVAGTYSLTVTDDNGTSNTLASAFTVNAAPTVTTTTPTAISAGGTTAAAGGTSVVITGTGFVTGATVTYLSTVNSTKLLSAASGAAVTAADLGHTDPATSAFTSATSLTTFVAPLNATTDSTPTAGTYALVVTNADGGTVNSGGIFSLTSYGITNVTPSAVAIPSSGVTTTAVTINGSGFQTGASVTSATGASTATATATVNGTGVITAANTAVVGDMIVDTTTPSALPANTYVTVASVTSVTISTTSGTMGATDSFAFSPVQIAVSTVSPTAVTGTITNATGLAAPTRIALTVTNPGSPGNGASFTLPAAFGIGESSSVAPTITASSDSAVSITPGSASSTITLTGTGLSQYSTVAAFVGTGVTAATGVTVSSCAGNTGTSLTCTLTVASGAVAGPDNLVVSNNAIASAAFAGALTVGGPVITSMAPLDIPVGAPVGTVVTLTGSGFNNTATGHVTLLGGGSLAGTFAYASPTTATFVVTTAPNAADAVTATAPTMTVTETISAGVTSVSAPFTIAVGAAPVVNAGLTYVVGTTGVGAGASAQTIVVNGTGFQAGAKVAGFTNSNGVADTGVVATVTAINTAGTTITATVAVPAGDANLSDGYTVTNPDGGFSKVSAFGTGALALDAGPTITSVTPATVTQSSTSTFVIVGTGFATTAKVSSSSTNATCGPTTNTSSTSVTATCTLVAATGAVSLVVTNPDGGAASMALTTSSAPAVPTGVTATGAANSVIVKWVAPTNTGGSAITGYAVAATAGNTTTTCGTVSATATTCTITGLAASTAYSVTVAAINALGTSPAATASATTTANTPPAKGFSLGAVSGAVIHGKTVTITISGTGFYGQPKVTSSAAGTKAVVAKDTGTVITVRVTSAANVRGEHTFTVTLANGKSAMRNYLIK